jgi:YVTN family beta-propeller protein
MTGITATAIDGFSSQVSVQVTSLPSGITVSPSSGTLILGSPLTLTVSVASDLPAGTSTVIFTGNSGSLTHTANLQVKITAGGSGGGGAALSTRTKYVRTDATTEYYLSLNTHWVVFDPSTSRFFVTDPSSNRIIVLDPATETEIATIPVPGAYGMDETPDHSALYVGTFLGDVYKIDPVAMQVTHRYLASEIGPYGFPALSALVLSDGRLALLGEEGGIPSVDGSTSIAVWNPADNSITIYGSPILSGVPSSPLCGSVFGLHIFAFALTSDRTSILTNGGGGLCEMNPSTGSFQSAAINGSAENIFASPDGNYLAFPSYPNSIVLYNAHTLTQIAQFNSAGDNSSAANIMFSPDSQTLFIQSSTIVYAYSVATQKEVGWLPNIWVDYTSGGFAVGPATGPIYEVTDGTGLMVGPLEEGFGFLDTTQLRTGPVGTGFTNNYLTPDTGPISGGTPVQFSGPDTPLTGVYFDLQPATNLTESSGMISATTPAGTAGPADVYVLTIDGGMQLIPDGFSYGPSILEVTPDLSTADGGGAGVIYGYGFGLLNATTIPSDLSVSVGGKPATIVGFNANAYNILGQPFPLQSIYYTIPSGSVGSVGVTVTTSSGSATAAGALTYLPVVHEYPLTGAALVQGIYDPIRDLYYFTDAGKIQVFSLAQKQWLSPINIPAPPGATQRLWGLALSPDGSKLAVADAQADVIYLVDPANPSSVKTFPLGSVQQGIIVDPGGVAISDSGIVYVTTAVIGGTGFNNYFTVDTNTGTVTPLGITGPGSGATDIYLRTEISADNTRVFFNNDGYVFSLDTSTGTVFSASAEPGCCYGTYELALSQNQIQFAASDYLYDSDLNAQSFLTLNDREAESVTYVYGDKLSPDGSLLFQPSTNGIDIFDGRIGNLRDRLALPFALSTNYDALVEDGKDNVLLAITGATGNGIAVVDLSSVTEPPPLPYAAELSSQRLAEDRAAARGALLPAAAQSTAISNRRASGPRFVPHVTRTNNLIRK